MDLTTFTKEEWEIHANSYETAVLYYPDGEIIGSFPGDKDGVRIPIWVPQKGNILTHNHPVQHPGGPSWMDLHTAISTDLQELRVVCLEDGMPTLYRLYPDPEVGWPRDGRKPMLPPANTLNSAAMFGAFGIHRAWEVLIEKCPVPLNYERIRV